MIYMSFLYDILLRQRRKCSFFPLIDLVYTEDSENDFYTMSERSSIYFSTSSLLLCFFFSFLFF